jgi:hypothetical protein
MVLHIHDIILFHPILPSFSHHVRPSSLFAEVKLWAMAKYTITRSSRQKSAKGKQKKETMRQNLCGASKPSGKNDGAREESDHVREGRRKDN